MHPGMEIPRHAATYEAGGEGAILGAAAGELLVSGTRGAYGFGIQQAVLTAYHLMREQPAEHEAFAADLLEFAYPADGRPNVYRSPDAWFTAFLQEARWGPMTPMPFRNPGAGIRAVPVGLWFRKAPGALIAAATESARATHTRPESAVSSSVLAGAVAAAGFGQMGWDLINGAAEIAERSERYIGASTEIPDALRRVPDLVGRTAREVAGEILGWKLEDPEVEATVLAVALASPGVEQASVIVREAAGVPAHAEQVAPLVGAIVGARSGLHRWPWPVPNDLWFAEIGRRLARQTPMVEDLPDPYAVEEVLNYELATDTLVER